MDYTNILYEVSDHVATLTLNRPDQLNAFTNAMVREMRDAFDRADADDDVRAVIVTGSGRGFCAGADLSSGAETFERPAILTWFLGEDRFGDLGSPEHRENSSREVVERVGYIRGAHRGLVSSVRDGAIGPTSACQFIGNGDI